MRYGIKKMKYKVIQADPPWQQGKGGKKKVRPNSSGGKLDYPTLDLISIKRILWKASKIAEYDHTLFLWATEKHLFNAQKIAEELGYKLHIRMIWYKITGMAPAFSVRYTHEYLLYMYKGKFQPVALEQRGKIASVFIEQVTKHSKKPKIAYEIIESLYPEGNKLELFARGQREGWDVFGNDVENSIDLETKQ